MELDPRRAERLMARKINYGPQGTGRQATKPPSDLGFYSGAGDGNRTRTISLGIGAIRAVVRPDLRRGVSASDRARPSVP